jgi:hypothetical protein
MHLQGKRNMPSLQSLNYGAAFFHFVQAVTVVSLIAGLNSKHKDDPPLQNGIYSVQKNLYVIRYADDSHPKCDLPRLINVSKAPGMSLNMSASGLLMETNNYAPFMEGAVAVHQNFAVGYLDTRYMIFGFFTLSCIFQAFEALWGDYSGPRLLRFVEYSISSSVMIMAIAVQVGLTDVYILVAMFTLMFATNLLGLIAELLCFLAEAGAISIWLWTIPHFLGWVTCLVAYAPILDAYLHTTRCSDRGPPGFVNVIVFLEFFMFICFGFVQVYSLFSKSIRFVSSTSPGAGGNYQQASTLDHMDGAFFSSSYPLGAGPQHPSQDITDAADLAYVTLSFTAKTLLAWLILAPTL